MATPAQLRGAFRRVQNEVSRPLMGQPDSVVNGRQALIQIGARISGRGLSNLPAGNYNAETAALNAAADGLRDAPRTSTAAMLAAIAAARTALSNLAGRLGV